MAAENFDSNLFYAALAIAIALAALIFALVKKPIDWWQKKF
jgi:hypothetical protein